MDAPRDRARRTLLARGAKVAAYLSGAAGAAALAGVDRAHAQVVDLDVPFVTTPDTVVVSMLELGGVGGSDFLIDLGSGDGRIPITAALRWGTRGFGVEIDPRLVATSRDNARKAGVADKVRFDERDLFTTDLTQATVITMYLLPDVNIKLRPTLLELAPGTRIVSHDWDMGDWAPDKGMVVPAPDKRVGLLKQSKLWLWVIPARLGGRHVGRWFDGRPLQIELRQTYQRIDTGQLAIGDERMAITGGNVGGRRVWIEAQAAGRAPILLDGELGERGTMRWQLRGEPARSVETSRS